MILFKQHLLDLIIFSPLLGVVGLLFLKESMRRWLAVMSGVGSLVPLGLGLFMLRSFRGVGGLEYSDYAAWIPQLGISYWIAVDGLSLFLIILTLLAMPIAHLIVGIRGERVRAHALLLLLLETALLGSYFALDLFLFYLFLELSTLLLFLLIGLSGSKPDVRAARGLLILNLSGSALILISWAALSVASGGTTNLAELLRQPLDLHQQTVA